MFSQNLTIPLFMSLRMGCIIVAFISLVFSLQSAKDDLDRSAKYQIKLKSPVFVFTRVMSTRKGMLQCAHLMKRKAGDFSLVQYSAERPREISAQCRENAPDITPANEHRILEQVGISFNLRMSPSISEAVYNTCHYENHANTFWCSKLILLKTILRECDFY